MADRRLFHPTPPTDRTLLMCEGRHLYSLAEHSVDDLTLSAEGVVLGDTEVSQLGPCSLAHLLSFQKKRIDELQLS